MKLTGMDLRNFVEKIASKEPAPGGGSVAAYTAAMGAGLTVMVAELTIGKKKYAQHEELMKEIITEAQKYKEELIQCVDKDTEAYNKVTAVFGMPKNTEEEKAAREEAMQSALKLAAKIPLQVMELCLKALKTTEKALGKSNQNAITDLGVASLNLYSGLKGAWLNVLINLSSIKDGQFLDECMKLGTALSMEGEKIRETVNEAVLKSVM